MCALKSPMLQILRGLVLSECKPTTLTQTIVSRGDWLGKPANIKVENNGAVGYVGSSLTVHNPLFFVHKL